jgi:hypothetical protein
MANHGARLNKLFLGLGLAGGGAMIAIAKGAPAVAGSMANMQVKAGELQRILGEALAPSFEMVSEAFADFVGWIKDHQEGISYFTETILGGFIGALAGIKKGWSWITENVNDFLVKIGVEWDLGDIGNYLLKHFGPETVAAMIGGAAGGAIGGPPGAAIGAGLAGGAVYAGRRIDDSSLFTEELKRSAELFVDFFSPFSTSQIRKALGLTLTDQT